MNTPSESVAGPTPEGPAGTAPGNGPGHVVHMTLGGKPSGLRNPSRAIRSLGAGALVLEVIVLLLAIQPIRVLTGTISTEELIVIFGAIAAALFIAGMLKYRLGWWLGSLLQVGLIVAGYYLHWIIGAVGVVFGLAWIYVLHTRRTLQS